MSNIDNLVDFLCPCGFGNPYDACCGPIHHGALAPTAERLMRSRYSAFVLHLGDYLAHSWHPETRPEEFTAGDIEFDADLRWLRLLIDETEKGGPFDTEGFVTFTAIGRTHEGRFVQRERSRFVRLPDEKRWVYVDGNALE